MRVAAMRKLGLSLLLVLAWAALVPADDAATEKRIADFESESDIAIWENLVLPDPKQQEPAVKIEPSTEHATHGKQSLKLTFAGGVWPTITTAKVDDAWLNFKTFHADVYASRPCLVGFTVLQEKSQRGDGWDPVISRWTKTAFLKAGDNHITGSLVQPNDYAIHAKWGKIVRFEIFLYAPHENESIFVDNIRLDNEKLPPPPKVEFKLVGNEQPLVADHASQAVIALGKELKDKWKPPTEQTVADVELRMSNLRDELQKTHPKARLLIFRDGAPGHDPMLPDKPYAGWKDAYFNSHGPDGMMLGRAELYGKRATQEVFMRHRSPLMQVDFSGIPKNANILGATLMIVRAGGLPKEHDPLSQPTMWVVEPCNRPWVETEVNAYEYAKDKFWKEIGGMSWSDQDPDFPPVFLAHGPGQGKVNTWDFADAVRYWTSGQHENHGFMLHGDSKDYMIAYSREAEDEKNRPAVFVIYEGK
jgi:hypothetical protein